MRKFLCILILMIFLSLLSYAEINVTIEDCEKSGFFAGAWGAVDETNKECVQKLQKGDADSYVMEGIMNEHYIFTSQDNGENEAAGERVAEFYRKALELEPDHFEGHKRLANLYRRLRRYREAIPILEKLIRREPQNAYFFYYLGYNYEQVKNYEKAIQAYTTGINLFENMKSRTEQDEEVYNLSRDNLNKLRIETSKP